jgi:hypothetical protein
MIKLIGVAVCEPEYDAPVSGNPNRMKPLQITPQSVKSEPGNINVFDFLRRIDNTKTVFQT